MISYLLIQAVEDAGYKRPTPIQVGESFNTYGKHLPLKSVVVYGGVEMEPQIKAIEASAGILVATPGRLLDLIGFK